jgi:tetratricopeptide (TPR) repeat protein
MRLEVILIGMFIPALCLRGGQPEGPATSSRLADLESALASQPGSVELLQEFATEVTQQARLTGNRRILEKAAAAVSKWEASSPGLPAARLRMHNLLGDERFAEARQLAQEWNRKMPDDLEVRSLLTEACLALGDYRAAEHSAQWMLDLRPEDPLSLSTAAGIRVLIGNYKGALNFYAESRRRRSDQVHAEASDVLAKVATLYQLMGDQGQAARIAAEAVKRAPHSFQALLALAAISPDEQTAARLAAAVEANPRADLLFALGDLYSRLNQPDRAQEAFRRLPAMPARPSEVRAVATHYLVHASKRAEALRLTTALVESVRDVESLALHARVLSANGRDEESREFERLARQLISEGKR